MRWNSFKGYGRSGFLVLAILLATILTVVISKNTNALDLFKVEGYVRVGIPLADIKDTRFTFHVTLYDVTTSPKTAVGEAMTSYDATKTSYDPNKFHYSFDPTLTTESGAIFTGLVDKHKYQVCIDKASNGPICSDTYTVDAKASGFAEIDIIMSGKDDYKKLPSSPLPVDSTNTNTTSCSIDGIGWIICPVLRFLGSIADGSFGIFDNFLKTEPELLNTSSPTYKAWEIMRSFANVAFVIAFLIIIFSQLTSIGITNYGVKKLLPRLIIAAILVNVSYFICQILVDFSNITGQSLKSLLDAVASQMSDPQKGTWNGSTGWTTIIGTTIAVASGATIAWASIATLIPAIVAVVLAFIMILFILAARQAIIVLLIAISPLAFVAFLLPNTESWFKKWRTTFLSMLLLFPIISVVYGISALASDILLGVMTGTLGQIIASSIRILPLFLVPTLLKKSLDNVGNIGGMINSIGGRISGNATDRIKNSGLMKYKEAQDKRNMALTRAGVRDLDYTGKNPLRQANKLRSRAHGFLNRNMGQYGAELTRTGVALANQMEDVEMKNERNLLMKDITTQQATNPNFNKDSYMKQIVENIGLPRLKRAAAMQELAAAGRDEEIRSLQSSMTDPNDRLMLQSAINTNQSALINKAPDIIKGNNSAFNNVTGESLANFSSGTVKSYMKHLENLHTIARAPGSTQEQQETAKNAIASFNSSIADITKDTSLQAKFKVEAGRELLKVKDSAVSIPIANQTPWQQSITSGELSGLAAIQDDGKIR